jgi:hypothetical protein
MTKRRVTTHDERLDPWGLATLFATSSLQEYPATLNRVNGYLRSRALKQVCDLASSPYHEHQGMDINEWLALRQLSCLFRKNESLTSADAVSNAEVRFSAAERHCRITNKRIDYYVRHPDRVDPDVWQVVEKARFLIRQLLGNVDSRILNQVGGGVRLTSGATEDRTRRRSFPFLKVTGKLRAPPTAFPYLRALLSLWGVETSAVRLVPVVRNTVTLVPKNWKTHRTIAKEPTHSLPFQLSLDSILKGKLRKWGVDLSNQKPNQDLALEGSLTGLFSTIDLEMASDTLSVNTVAMLIPDDWFELLRAFRSPGYKGVFGSGWYAKFSSMGNGYTFSLETLIFAALVKAVGSTRFAVYGDDIVIESTLAPRLCKALNFLGFTVNLDKSCISDRPGFRESCGVDCYNGNVVTPFYLRENPRHTDKAAVCHVINGLVRVSHPGPLWDWCEGYVRLHKLRLVPFNDDTMSGIHLDVQTAYALRKLKTPTLASKSRNPWVPYFAGYGPRSTLRTNHGRRSLWLWYISRQSQADGHVAGEARRRRSSILLDARRLGGDSVTVSVLRVTYGSKTRKFSPSVLAVPLTLHLWSERWMASRAKARLV